MAIFDFSRQQIIITKTCPHFSALVDHFDELDVI
jgi:hypothetical protein